MVMSSERIIEYNDRMIPLKEDNVKVDYQKVMVWFFRRISYFMIIMIELLFANDS